MNPESLAELFEAAAAGAAAARLLHLRLAGRQPGLLVFLIFMALDLFGLSCLAPDSTAYFYFYMVSVVANWLVSLYVVREMFALAFDAYPGIRTIGLWSIYGTLAASVTACLAFNLLSWDGGAQGRSKLYYVEVADRSVVFTLAVVVVAIMLVLSRYPLHLGKNTYVSCSFFSAVFLSEAAMQAIDTYAPHLYSRDIDTVQILFSGVCFLAWAVMLRQAEADPAVRVKYESPEERQLLLQLESLNNLLARSGRR